MTDEMKQPYIKNVKAELRALCEDAEMEEELIVDFLRENLYHIAYTTECIMDQEIGKLFTEIRET